MLVSAATSKFSAASTRASAAICGVPNVFAPAEVEAIVTGAGFVTGCCAANEGRRTQTSPC